MTARSRLVKNYTAEAAIGSYLFVRPGSADYSVVQASAGADRLFGITTEVDATLGERVDVVHQGLAWLRLGGAVTRGDLLMADAQGRGVAAAAAAGVNVRVGAKAVISGAAGDVIRVLVTDCVFQG